MEKTEKLLLSVPEAAHLLSVGKTTVFNLIKDEKLTAVRIGRRTLVKAEEVERFAKELAA